MKLKTLLKWYLKDRAGLFAAAPVFAQVPGDGIQVVQFPPVVDIAVPVLPEPQKGGLGQVLGQFPLAHMPPAIGIDGVIVRQYQGIQFVLPHVFTTVHCI